jgi:hypothetical protein
VSWRGRRGFREYHVSLSLSTTGGFKLSYHTIIFPYCGDDLGEPVPARVKSATHSSRSQSSQDLRAGGRAGVQFRVCARDESLECDQVYVRVEMLPRWPTPRLPRPHRSGIGQDRDESFWQAGILRLSGVAMGPGHASQPPLDYVYARCTWRRKHARSN